MRSSHFAHWKSLFVDNSNLRHRSVIVRSLLKVGPWAVASVMLLSVPAVQAQAQPTTKAQPSTRAQSDSAAPLLRVEGLCGPLENHFGPFDYRTAKTADRSIVERFHFTPSVENLEGGQSGYLGQDLNYTLRVFPNHPRALAAMARYAVRLKSMTLPHVAFPAECYFDRAIRFVPDDAQVRALYADFLIRFKRPKDARAQLEAAERIKPTSPQILYNLALGWNAIGENDKALPLARRAYAGGIQFPGLRDRLVAAGVWRN